ncbi:MAG: DoxX family protein [Terracidiphilus sp.]|jgi:uncharacterized membrane protein YphA (DoxX/SURF4 family)
MNGLIWIGQVALAGVFLTLGTAKLFAYAPLVHALESRADIHITMTPFSARIVGFLEVLLAFGVLIPDIYASDGMVPEYMIVRTCATGMAVLMIGAAIYHMRRKEQAVLDFALFLMALFVIVGRWPI